MKNSFSLWNLVGSLSQKEAEEITAHIKNLRKRLRKRIETTAMEILWQTNSKTTLKKH